MSQNISDAFFASAENEDNEPVEDTDSDELESTSDEGPLFGSVVLVKELVRGGAVQALGAPLRGAYRAPFPSFDDEIEDDERLIAVSSAPATAQSRPAPARLVNFVAENWPRETIIDERSTDAEGIERRMAALGRVHIGKIPARGVTPDSCGASAWLRILAEYATVAHGLSAEHACEALADRLTEAAPEFSAIEILAFFRDAAALTDSIYAFDVDGQRADTEARIAEERARREKEAEAAEKARLRARETRTCGELGLLLYRQPLRDRTWPAGLTALCEDGARSIYIAKLDRIPPEAVIAGESRSHLEGEVMPSSTVPPCTVGQIEAFNKVPITPTSFFALAVGRPNKEPIATFFDERTSDGRWRARLGRAYVAARADHIARNAQAHGFGYGNDGDLRLCAQVLVRGLRLAPDLALEIYREQMRFASRELVAGALALDESRWNALAREAVSGADAWLSPDQMFREPKPGEVGIIAEVIDPFFAALRALVAKASAPFKSEDVEAHLQAAGVVDHPLGGKEHSRVSKILEALGWKKKQMTIEGERERVYVKVSESDD